MTTQVKSSATYAGMLVEYLDGGRFRPGLAIREQDHRLVVADAEGRERMVARDLVMMPHPDRRPSRDAAAEAIDALAAERAMLARELDLNLLWEVVQEQGRSFSASELADLFFGRGDSASASVMLEALLADRIYFTRRHMDFSARPPDQVERLRTQQERVRAKSGEYQRTLAILRDTLAGTPCADPAAAAELGDSLNAYLKNPHTRSREMTQMLSAAAPEIDPAEAAFEILERLGAKPAAPRFALIAGLSAEFASAQLAEAHTACPAPRPEIDAGYTLTIDNDDTVEIDDALSCEPLEDGSVRVRIHIALLADFVAKGGAMDQEAASRASTVYLPETTVWMLPPAVSCDVASLVEGTRRPVLTTEVTISASGEPTSTSIYPAQISISRRLEYSEADRILDARVDGSDAAAPVLRLLLSTAEQLRRRRGAAGAMLIRRRETKVKVRGDDIQISVLDSDSPARMLVAEFMILSNFVAARYAAENRIPIIYRVQPDGRIQPDSRGEAIAMQRPRLSLYPEYHSGIGLDYYAQLSSPIRRYADLVLQRQLLATLSNPRIAQPYTVDELLAVLAGAENAEAAGRELERRSKRYWTLRYLERLEPDAPLRAIVTREGAGAELLDFAVRGTLRGAPTLPDGSPIIVQLNRVDPLRGWLAFDYLRPAESAAHHVP